MKRKADTRRQKAVSAAAVSPAAIRVPQSDGPLLSFLPFQDEVFWRDDLGLLHLSWRRQAGKSYTMASKALRRSMELPGWLSVFISASLRLGAEFVRKDAEVWQTVMAKARERVATGGLKLETSADGVDFDGLCDLFEHQKLEAKIWHDRTRASRIIVVAPNPDTAVGWTGDVYFDEVGRMPEFKDLMEAAEPILSRHQEFRWMMATTPPPDDTHYSYELLLPKDQFTPNARGNWYVSEGGVTCHRLDAWDGQLAGLKLYDRNTRRPISPEEHRAQAFDKVAWDRNYGVKFIRSGTAAVSAMALHTAMQLGAGQGVAANVTEEIVP